MKQLNWVLQSNLIKQEIIDNIKIALRLDNIKYEEVKIIPFSDELPDIQNPSFFNIFYGSTTLILNAYKDNRFSKGIFFDNNLFNTQNYLKYWGEGMLNYDSRLTTFPEFANEPHSENSEWFLRPNEDDKSFSGTVMSFKNVKKMACDLQNSNNPYLTSKTVISVSTPKTIQKEWRHFIVDKKVVSSSRYMFNRQFDISTTDIPAELIKFVEQRCNEYVPNSIFVMDTALCNDKFSIIECNCFNGTGFYKHDIVKIIRAVNEYLQKSSAE
ncbi:MAG: DUF4343 domain-containing protein [Cytophagales bacterium]|nr:MAG: DUF4343 domain-containing protein [Cytophagales bacterium]